MKLEIVTNEKDNLEFYIEGERHTLTNLLKEKLSENESVDFVAYKLDHPSDTKAKFVLKAKNAKKVLIDTLKEIEKEFDSFKKEFSKSN